MKRLAYILAAAVLAVAPLEVSAARPGAKTGTEFSSMSHNFGTVSAARPSVSHKFTVYNRSRHAVSILSARASCGCTEPSYDHKPIAPGDSAHVTVTFLTSGQRGEFTKDVTLRLRSADNKSEKVHLQITGTVVPPQN